MAVTVTEIVFKPGMDTDTLWFPSKTTLVIRVSPDPPPNGRISVGPFRKDVWRQQRRWLARAHLLHPCGESSTMLSMQAPEP